MTPRIVVISEDLVEPWDEGIKKFAVSIGRALASDHAVRIINVDRSGFAARRNGARGAEGGTPDVVDIPGTRSFIQPRLRHEVASFRPDIVIYVPSPSSTVRSFLRSFVLHRHWPRARQAMVALIPRRHASRLKPLLQGSAPDMIFVPSYASLLHLSDLKVRGDLLPVGVDLAQFRPARDGEAQALRRAHKVPADAYVYLHVGHLSRNRNLGVLARLAREPGAHVIVIGSTSTPEDLQIRLELERAGVRVIREFVPVDEFYRLADCYVFPVVHGEGAIEIPLSVLESLACGTPVITRAFGGLRDFLPAGPDVSYFENDDDLIARAHALRQSGRPATRDMRDFAWRAIADRLVARLTAAVEGRPS